MTKYVYHSEKTKTTCYECSKNDGKVFQDIKDVPKLPIHPNCKCYIETIEETSNSNDECNCKDRMEILRNNVSNILLNADNLNKDIEKELLECAITFKDNQESNEYETIKNNYFAIEDNIQELIKSTNDLSTDIDILKEYNYDPLYHTKEECGMNDGLSELNNSLTNLFNKLNTISQNIKYLKEKRITAQKQFEEKAKEEARKEARAKEEAKAAERLKGGIPTGAAAGVKDSDVNKDQSSNSSLRLTGGVEINAPKDEIANKNTGKTLASEEKIKEYMSEYKKVLINTLSGVFYPPALIKYNIDELEQLIKKSNLLPALKEKIMTSPALQALTEKMIGGNYNQAKYFTYFLAGKDVQGTLDLAHGENNMKGKNYLTDTIKLENYNDPILKNHKDAIMKKEKEQFEKDYGFNIDNIPGYYFGDYSKPSKRIAENKDFHNILKKYKNHILTKNKDFNSVNFPKHGPLGVLGDSNLHNSIGKADILDYYFDKEGNLHMKLFDTYEFNKDAEDFLNKAGRSQMKQGNLKPYFSVYDIIVPKQDLDRIWNN